MDDRASALLIKALDALQMRSVATAQNIANANTRGYRPVRVTFEQALAAAAPRGPAAIRAVQPQVETLMTGDSLRLDLEMANASATSGRYGALIELLNRRLQLHAIATKGTL